MLVLLRKMMPEKLIIFLWKHIFTKKWIRRKLVWHFNEKFIVGCEAVILNEEGEVLILKSSYKDAEWGLPAGFMEHEDPVDAMKREVMEETGFEVDIDEVFENEYNNASKILTMRYKGMYKSGEFRESKEVLDYKFCKVEELSKYVMKKEMDVINKSLKVVK